MPSRGELQAHAIRNAVFAYIKASTALREWHSKKERQLLGCAFVIIVSWVWYVKLSNPWWLVSAVGTALLLGFWLRFDAKKELDLAFQVREAYDELWSTIDGVARLP